MRSLAPDTVVHVQVTVDPVSKLPLCAPDPVPVTVANTLIVFDLTTDGYRFPSTAAVQVNSPGVDFPYACWRTDNKTVALYDAAIHTAAYAYKVTVVQTSTGEAITVDPSIDNRTH
jgi:hypothetical protein